VVGVIHLPALGETTHAAAGAGCFHDGVRARASEITRLDKAVLMVSGFKYAWSRFPPDAVRLLTERCWTVRAFSGCYDVTMLARGKADIWLSGSGMEWDYAPARVIADECGARFFTADGTGRIDRDNCVICAPGLEAELRRILRVGGESGPA
jgi:fructose-1,6-bisphosphatase/inositol monophosphatase family enzyme